MKRNHAFLISGLIFALAASCAQGEREKVMAFQEKAAAPMVNRALTKTTEADFAADAVESAPAPASVPAVDASPRTAESGVERKLVRSANLRLRVSELGAAEAAAQSLVSGFGGYVASSNKTEESLSMSLRVPRASFDAALTGLKPLGTELWRNVDTQDVTLHWYDLSGRLETKRQLMTTLRGYLKSARTIEDIMTVETKLADLQNEIDSLGGQFRRLTDLVDFATINVEFVLPAAKVKNVEPTLGERVGEVLRKTGAFFSSLIAFLVGAVVFGVPILILAALLFWLLFGKVGLLLKLYRAVARPAQGKKKETP